jgi:hypothetical protein
MSSAGVFHAKTFHSQASKQVLNVEHDQDSFMNLCESFAWYDRDTSSWKTYQQSFLTDWTPFLESWPRQGLMRNGHVFQRALLEPAIGGIGGGALPTPRSCSAMAARLTTSGNLEGKRFPNLETAITGLLPTPVARDHKGRSTRNGALPNSFVPPGGGIYLNPSFVEEMMGFPIEWTALKR